MAKRIIALGWEPATWKTTLMKDIRDSIENLKPFKYKLVRWIYDKEKQLYFIWVFTWETFEWTDKLSMAVLPDFIKFLTVMEDDITVVFEWDRLFTQKLFRQIPNIDIIIIETTDEVKEIRHEKRKDNQNEKFLKAKKTKLKNIKEEFKHQVFNNNTDEEYRSNIDIIMKKIKN